MVFTMLSLDDFLGTKSTPNMTRWDYLLDVSKVALSKYEEENNLFKDQKEEHRIKKEEKITHNIQSISSSFPQVLDHQEKPILDFVVPKGKRSMPNARPRKVTEQCLCNVVGESMIKKAVENNSEQQHRVKSENRLIKINWGVGVSNQEFFPLEKSSQKHHEEEENKVFKTNWKGSSANFVPFPIIRKRSRQVANDSLGFNKKLIKKEATRKKKKVKRNAVVRVEAPPVVRVKAPPVVIISRELDIAFKNRITSIGGSLESVKLVIEKRLFKSDVKKGEGRLSIPEKQLSNEFLEPEEDELLNTRNELNMCEMRVMLIEPSLERSEINLRKWFMNKDSGSTSLSYVLVTYWNEVAKKNDLKLGSMVQLWAFRKGPDLCFALVKLQD